MLSGVFLFESIGSKLGITYCFRIFCCRILFQNSNNLVTALSTDSWWHSPKVWSSLSSWKLLFCLGSPKCRCLSQLHLTQFKLFLDNLVMVSIISLFKRVSFSLVVCLSPMFCFYNRLQNRALSFQENCMLGSWVRMWNSGHACWEIPGDVCWKCRFLTSGMVPERSFNVQVFYASKIGLCGCWFKPAYYTGSNLISHWLEPIR